MARKVGEAPKSKVGEPKKMGAVDPVDSEIREQLEAGNSDRPESFYKGKKGGHDEKI